MRPLGGTPYVGELAIFAGNFAPQGWALCNGQQLAISENETLFQLIGTTYGGDGENYFNLPDLQGRAPVHAAGGTSIGLSTYQMGQQTGVESVTLTVAQLPPHTHPLPASSLPGTTASPLGAVPADNGAGSAQYTLDNSSIGSQPTQNLGSTGGNQPHANMQPYLAINYIISLYGIFPSQT
ncbi:phage tail protein [Hymenobacter sp. HMF4947]|uniref:Phage tail protein n=2 Tax=Hymenobacter ginkgonis TaxID=2682976 RepID=A0A7K1TB84_9BACT|nr:phage tail protein [Hymenobacter ginkgonis]